ncbi:MAG: sigma-54 dependent transcriptional regulator [Ignavibacteria bacterium]|nr:sigma-54 dependent transcriptional regulator [Ignavibacteria bacterium]
MDSIPISILAVDDEASYLDVLRSALEWEGYFVQTATDGIAAIDILQTLPFDLVLLDIKMPGVDGVAVLKYVKENFLDTQVIMLTGVNEISVAVDCMRIGAYHYVTKPYSTTELLAIIDRALERKRLLVQNKALRSELARLALCSDIISQDKRFLDVVGLAKRAAPTESSILIQGESGTGKELIANFLHRNSVRKDQPFVALSCSSIPETLVESELFGHEKGAFTDAVVTKQGLVEIAHGGTLFLDEVGEMPTVVQPKLLRFLESREYRRVGGNLNLRSDVRIISATNKDLPSELEAGRFREDLFYRLNVIVVHLPPLRERKNDVPLLAEHFLKKHSRTEEPKRLDENVLQVLMKYDWPGNVRELENVIERAAVLSQDDLIHVEDLALPLGRSLMLDFVEAASTKRIHAGSAISLAQMQKAHVEGVLNSVKWDKKTAAKILGISVKTLYGKIQVYNLSKGRRRI